MTSRQTNKRGGRPRRLKSTPKLDSFDEWVKRREEKIGGWSASGWTNKDWQNCARGLHKALQLLFDMYVSETGRRPLKGNAKIKMRRWPSGLVGSADRAALSPQERTRADTLLLNHLRSEARDGNYQARLELIAKTAMPHFIAGDQHLAKTVAGDLNGVIPLSTVYRIITLMFG